MKEKMLEIIKYNGLAGQLKHFYTEIFELTEAIYIYNLEEEGGDYFPNYKEHIVEELGDCFNHLIQIALLYNISKEDIMEVLEYKVNRTYNKVQNGEEI